MYSDDYEYDNYKNSKLISFGRGNNVYAWEDYVYPNYDVFLNIRRDRFTGLRLLWNKWS